MEYMLPFVIASSFVLLIYMFKGNGDPNDSNKVSPPYFVIFCVGLVLAFGGMFFMGNNDETVNNMMKVIDMGDPNF